MKAKDVTYYGVLIDKEDSEKLMKLTEKIAQKKGLNLEDFTPQENMHFTIAFLQNAKNNPEILEQNKKKSLTNSELGKHVSLKFDKLGFYMDGDTILNVGVALIKTQLENITLGENGRTMAQLSQNEIPHVTISINPDKEIKAKAVDTQKCFWKGEDFDHIIDRENPNSIIISTDEPIEISGTTAAFRFNQVAFQLENEIEEVR